MAYAQNCVSVTTLAPHSLGPPCLVSGLRTSVTSVNTGTESTGSGCLSSVRAQITALYAVSWQLFNALITSRYRVYETLFEMNNYEQAAQLYRLDGAVGTVTGLRTGQSGFDAPPPQPPWNKRCFSSPKRKTGSGDHPASFGMDSGDNFPAYKTVGGRGERGGVSSYLRLMTRL